MQALTFVFAFVAVLALIGVAAWLVRRFAGNRLGANTHRARMPRLGGIAPWPDAGGTDGEPRSDVFDHAELQMPEPPPRPARPSFADEVRRPAPAISERRSDPLAGFTPEPLGNPLAGRPEPRPELRPE